jgi:hypothetical protein
MTMDYTLKVQPKWSLSQPYASVHPRAAGACH